MLIYDFILNIKDDVGFDWYDFGIVFGIEVIKVCNLRYDYLEVWERVYCVLEIWIEKNGREVIVGCFVCVFIRIKCKRIVDKLFGM